LASYAVGAEQTAYPAKARIPAACVEAVWAWVLNAQPIAASRSFALLGAERRAAMVCANTARVEN